MEQLKNIISQDKTKMTIQLYLMPELLKLQKLVNSKMKLLQLN